MFSFLKKLFGKKEPPAPQRVCLSKEDWDMFRKGLIPAVVALNPLKKRIEANEETIRSLRYEARNTLRMAVDWLERGLEVSLEARLVEMLDRRNAAIAEYKKLQEENERYAKILAETDPFLIHCRSMVSKWENSVRTTYPYASKTSLKLPADSANLLDDWHQEREKAEALQKQKDEEELSESLFGIAPDQPCNLAELQQKWAFWKNQGGDGARNG